MGKDYYATLGVSRDADEAAIKAAYKKAALKVISLFN
jgi:DnaJ-class molecular chaperone